MNRSTQHAFEPEEIMAYLDGELEPRQAAALASHLEHCIECRAMAAQLRQVSERLLEFEIEPCPSKAAEPIIAALDASDSEKPSKAAICLQSNRSRPRILAWAAAVMIVLAVLTVISIPNLLRPEKMALGHSATESDRLALHTQLQQGQSRKGEQTVDNARVGGPPPLSQSQGLQALSNAGGGDHPLNSLDGQSLNDALSELPEPKVGVPGGLAGRREAQHESAEGTQAPEIRGPMIVETASMRILAANFDQASSQIQPLTAARGGYVQDLTADTRTGAARSLSGTLRVPDKQLEAFVADLRKLGHVEQETRDNQEVTGAYVDLTARLKTARATEQRIIELLGTRTGKLSDVLEAEEELDRVRGDIESMDGQRVNMEHQVRYATVQVQLNEEYREQLNPESFSTGRRLRNSFVEGLSNLAGGITGAAIFAFAYGPSILFWLAVAGLPAWFVWRRVRKTKTLAP